MSIPPWADRRRLDNKRDELDWTRRTGGYQQPNSGRTWFRKADVRDEDYLWDCKETEKGSYTINLKEWEKLGRQARKENGRMPGLKVTFVKGNGKKVELIIIPVPEES
jgi:hypothetical protein